MIISMEWMENVTVGNADVTESDNKLKLKNLIWICKLNIMKAKKYVPHNLRLKTITTTHAEG